MQCCLCFFYFVFNSYIDRNMLIVPNIKPTIKYHVFLTSVFRTAFGSFVFFLTFCSRLSGTFSGQYFVKTLLRQMFCFREQFLKHICSNTTEYILSYTLFNYKCMVCILVMIRIMQPHISDLQL